MGRNGGNWQELRVRGEGRHEPQTPKLSGESMNSVRDLAWAAGYAHGYERARNLIRQLAAHS